MGVTIHKKLHSNVHENGNKRGGEEIPLRKFYTFSYYISLINFEKVLEIILRVFSSNLKPGDFIFVYFFSFLILLYNQV